jgi:hypothetical protein
MAVKRCLIGMVLMQLTFMGVLALKSTPSKDKLVTLVAVGVDSDSSYVKYVFLVFPLLFITAGLHWWFR